MRHGDGPAPNTPRVQVEPGEIRIAGVDVLINKATCLVLEVDCHSKRPHTSVGYEGEDDAPGVPVVYLYADDFTLRPDEEKTGQNTRIILPEHTAGWTVTADETGRYTIRVVAYRPNSRHRRQIWPSLTEARRSR